MSKEEQFNIFWINYPRRISKGAAKKAFDKAIKKTSLDEMLKAIKVYIACKPDKIDFKHPATWLNSECWDDEWAPKSTQSQANSSSINGFGVIASRFQSKEEYIRYEIERNKRLQ